MDESSYAKLSPTSVALFANQWTTGIALKNVGFSAPITAERAEELTLQTEELPSRTPPHKKAESKSLPLAGAPHFDLQSLSLKTGANACFNSSGKW